MTADKAASEIDGFGITNLLSAARVSIRSQLFRSRLFDTKDDDAATELADRIIASDKGSLEDPSLMAALKKHNHPDFYILGDLRYFKNDDGRTWRLHLAVHDLSTGKILWEGVKDL